MRLLLDDAGLAARRAVAAGTLAPLAESLAADLRPLLARGGEPPAEKARMTRAGGRCPTDGSLLAFDPFSPDRHRCERCGAVYDEPVHHQWWVMSFHLWLAERAVHAAVLHALRRDEAHAALAREILDGYARIYAGLPNRDNVLGPSRPFFSTYLESIWLLQLAVAADAVAAAGDRATADRFVDRVGLPSAALIASFDEGASNRQVWNLAALLAVSRLAGDAASVERLIIGPRGLATHLGEGLLADGTWYEGENYHQFAHRGLWYSVALAERAGHALPPRLRTRFDDGFATPFLTALPDLTFPARRDSQWKVSLRQWRYAESAELGLARRDDPRLRGALAMLYAPDIPRRDTGRATSAAEAERNAPASSLTRVDLGWRSLLHALPELPALEAAAPRSVLLEAQGLAVFRRDSGRLYAALDYGHAGGGHGHPDRLNLMIAAGETRWLDDPGTGSYVDPTLFWYRSTLAHCAPLADGRSQLRGDGVLLAHEERGGAGWVEGRATIAPDVRAMRTIVVMPHYVMDVVRWESARDHRIDLPVHADGEVAAAHWQTAPLTGGAAADDGFGFVGAAERSAWPRDGWLRLDARSGGEQAWAWIVSREARELWRAVAPGPPGAGMRRFHLVRCSGREGAVLTVWDLERVVRAVARDGESIVVSLDGERHTHTPVESGWRIEFRAADATSSIELGGRRAAPDVQQRRPPATRPRAAELTIPQLHRPEAPRSDELPLRFELGGMNYRRSEQEWDAAGEPTASVSFWMRGTVLIVHVDVRKRDVAFAPDSVPEVLDNEPALIHGDGLQLQLILPARVGADPRLVSWLFAPREEGDVRVEAHGAPAGAANALAERTSGGWTLRAEVDLAGLIDLPATIELAVAINDMAPGRERRRGQLVLVFVGDEYVYLQGDRLLPHHFVPFAIAP